MNAHPTQGLLVFLLASCGGKASDEPPAETSPTTETTPIATGHTGSTPTSPTGDTSPSLPSEGCGTPGYERGKFSFDHNGVSRLFRIFVPTNYNSTTPTPLVLAFHGWGGNEDEFLGDSTVISEAEERGYIVVAPLGLGSESPDNTFPSWSFSGSTTGLDGDGVNPICDDPATANYTYRSCEGVAQNGCSWTHCQDDDIAFVLALLKDIRAHQCIDDVFATGGSNGGMFTWELGQNPQTAASFRGLVPLIGLPHRGHLAPKGTSADLPVMVVTGTRDPTVPPGDWEDPSFTVTSDGDRYFYTGATAITQIWAESHGCHTTSPATPYDDGYPQTDCRTYCEAGSDWPTVLDCRADMPHTYNFAWSWPLTLDFFDSLR